MGRKKSLFGKVSSRLSHRDREPQLGGKANGFYTIASKAVVSKSIQVVQINQELDALARGSRPLGLIKEVVLFFSGKEKTAL